MAIHLLPLICAAPAIINIAGVALPVDALKAAPRFVIDVAKHAPPKAIAKDALPIVESVSTALIPIPCLGLAAQIIAFALAHSRPPTPEDQQRMWDKAQGVQ